ncbi:MAG: right-handed parallel beta-helix repeat-containing protein [Planctomycetales bacterium]|nr:right-handed parallel beta-helix repeat-containing protein [Planctomycetales bacterium]
MNRNSILAIVVSISILCLLGAASTESPKLPGARAGIHAADFPSIQAALDAVPEEGGVVILPPGTFEISEPLVIHQSDVSFHGSGSSTHIKNVNESGQPAIVIAHQGHTRNGNDRQHELWRVRLANFRISGNANSGDGIVAYNVNEIFVDGISVSYHGGDGLKLSFCYEDPRIVSSLITYNKKVGVNLIGCHDIVVSSNQFEENQDGLHCIDGYNLCMTGNCLDDHLGDGVVIENTYGSVVSGNMIEECQAAAVVMDRDCYGNTVSANVIAHNGAGVDLRDAHGCAISANTFTIMQSDAVRIGPNSGRIAVSANAFSDSYIGEGSLKRTEDDRNAAGMVLSGAKDVLVSSNAFTGVRPTAISKASSDGARAAFTGNLFVDTATDVESETMSGSKSSAAGNFSIRPIE